MIVLAIAFYILSYTADEFLCPSLEEISKTFSLSESLAGVTLLAFGGGAPDVLSSLSATSGGDVEGIEMGIAILLGSSLCTLAFVSAAVIYVSPVPIQLNKWLFGRDALFLLSSMLLLMYSISIRGKIDFWMSVSFIALYVFYVTVVLFQDRSLNSERSSEVIRKAAAAAQITELNRIEKSY